MPLRFGVTVDCHDPVGLAEFWKGLLGYVDHPAPAGWSTWHDHDQARGLKPGQPRGDWTDDGWAIVDPDDLGERLFFQRVPEPKTVKNRLHLDVRIPVSDLDVEAVVEHEIARAVGLGASVLSRDRRVLADPEGNEFCLIGA